MTAVGFHCGIKRLRSTQYSMDKRGFMAKEQGGGQWIEN